MRQIQESREDQIERAQADQCIVSQEQGPKSKSMSPEGHNRTVLKKGSLTSRAMVRGGSPARDPVVGTE